MMNLSGVWICVASPAAGEFEELADAVEDAEFEWGEVGRGKFAGSDEVEGGVAGGRKFGFVADEVGDAEGEFAVLAGAEDVAGAAELEVGFGDVEPTGLLHESFEPCKGVGVVGLGKEEAVSLK